MSNRSQRLVNTAYHEAGHAVVMLHFGHPFETVWVSRNPDAVWAENSGNLIGAVMPIPFTVDESEHEKFKQEDAIVNASGKQAEMLAIGFDMGGSIGDVMANFLGDADEQSEAKAKAILSLPTINAGLHALAKALMERYELTFPEVERIILDAQREVTL